MSYERDLLTELFTVLRSDLGANDLSSVGGTHRVVLADGGHPPVRPPFVCLAAPARDSSHQAPLTEYHIAGTIRWWAFVGAGLSTEDRAFALLDLAAEVVDAIHEAHADPSFPVLYATTVVLAGWEDVFADEPDLPGFVPQVQGTIRYETDIRVGV